MRTRSVAFLALLLTACAPGSGRDVVDDGVAVPEGKEDDFFSTSAFEYIVEGRTQVVLEAELADADEATKAERVKQLIGYRQIGIAWFLTQYLLHKKADDSNHGFGGFGGMARAGAFEDLNVEQIDDLTFQFTFRQLIAGGRDLMRSLPTSVDENGVRTFDLEIGTPNNSEMAELETNNEWYRNAPWDNWNPSEVDADKKELLTMSIEQERSSTDAWFDYNELFEDSALTIDVHFGWDYHNDYHVRHARSVFQWLGTRGFAAEAPSFDEMTRTNNTFTKTILANGRDVEVEVRLFYGKTDTETDPDTDAGGQVLEQDMRESLRTRDAIVYSGHSGPFYGFALANWRKTEEGDFDDSEMAGAEMRDNQYQVIFAEGCDTYQIGEAFRQNSAKPDGALVDIITTTQASNASTPAAVQDFISRLIEEDQRGEHQPQTIKSLLTDLDSNSFFMHTMYGIHGIDDNPALHPYASLENSCESCSTSEDCGAAGNLCVGIGDERACAAACTDDRGCGDGFTCAAIASPSAGSVFTRACVPESFSCN